MKVAVALVAIALAVGALVGTLVVRDPGYVLIAYGDGTLETSLWVAVFGLSVIAVIVYVVIRAVSRMLRGGSGLSAWYARRRQSTARQKTLAGLLQMARGEWAAAKKTLLSVAATAETPLINYLNAARAAHELDDTDERDRLLRLAHETTPGSKFAVALTQAQLHLDKAQWEQCLAALVQLREEAPKHALVLTMLLRCYEELEDWESLQALVPQLVKQKVGDPERLRALECRSWLARLDRVRQSGEPARHAESAWNEIPKHLKSDPALVDCYADLLVLGGANREAEALLRNALGAEWRTEWVARYGRLNADPEAQRRTAQRWLKNRATDPSLLLALGRLSMMCGAWDDAREYFEATLRLARTPEVYGELGRLCLALGETERGTAYVLQALSSLPEVVLPEAPGSGAADTASLAAEESAAADDERTAAG